MKLKIFFISILISFYSLFFVTLKSFESVYVKARPDEYPSIGIYGSLYEFMIIDSAYKFTQNMILKKAPINLLKSVLGSKKIFFEEKDLRQDFFQKIKFNDVLPYGIFEQQISDKDTYNVVFHTVISRYKKGFFNFNQEIGLFTMPSGGISSAASESIAINKLSSVNINYHEGPAYSPNNAKFKIDNSRKAVSFWIAANLSEIGKISISYHLVFKNSIDSSFSAVFATSESTQQKFIEKLKKIKSNFLGNDALAVQEAIDIYRSGLIGAVHDDKDEPGPADPLPTVKVDVQKIISDCLAGVTD